MNLCTSIRVRYEETDQMGVVYHGNYFTWFDIGRTEFFRKLNIVYGQLEEEGILLPVIEANCEYIMPAKYDDEIIICTKLVKLKGVRLEFGYTLYRKEDNTLIAKGRTIHAFVDKNLKPINFKKRYREIWDLLGETI
ncbi:Thioesterase superfamily protein [[Clostridium] ultunense Esp]|uniref:Thioesterase superfamily protein n=1 Tax=[Clostridium] ultunense Esp TaxID=1288971 RepID=M1ZHH5_9FIRM|nr:thioesterase family protein [Schnuerera ultunensis]CCQ97974.1 Thioesterase superfamily protein [[Clostridium] ultunense Esp]SHD75639.1 Thioesterase superfamily protein [[Clostridium] ultunense Esp]